MSNKVDLYVEDSRLHRELISSSVNEALDGRLECNSTVTFTANTTTTTITDRLIHKDSVILLMPSTSNAAGENWYIGTVTNGSCVVTHANASTTDRTFSYIVLGA